MPDPSYAHLRRGSPFTFAPSRLLSLVTDLIEKPGEYHFAPSFDHLKKDPIENDIAISPAVKVIIVEGLYLQLDQPIWKEIYSLFHFNVWCEVDLETTENRLVERHIASGICANKEGALKRANMNDLVNAQFILAHRLDPDRILI
jgi:pantothenate kinase